MPYDQLSFEFAADVADACIARHRCADLSDEMASRKKRCHVFGLGMRTAALYDSFAALSRTEFNG